LSLLVLDASVAVKFAFPMPNEPYLNQALQLLDNYKTGKTELLVPDIFWAEIGNVAWKGVRQRRWSRAVADTAVTEMQMQDFSTVSSRELIGQAVTIALNYDRSVYDCLYIALAVTRNSTLVSADERLVNALGTYFPIEWLGVFS
jgi:predicted nucleic acid-binding protein